MDGLDSLFIEPVERRKFGRTAADEIRIGTSRGAFVLSASSVRAVRLGHVAASNPVKTTEASEKASIRHGAGRAKEEERGDGAEQQK